MSTVNVSLVAMLASTWSIWKKKIMPSTKSTSRHTSTTIWKPTVWKNFLSLYTRRFVKIPKETVAAVVEEASIKMKDPNYSAVMVGGFVQEQPQGAQYISSYADELGGGEAVAGAVFHAAVLALCFQRANNRSVRSLAFEDLDRVSEGDRKQLLEKAQPAILGYIEANVEGEVNQRVLMLLALAMDSVS